MNVLGSGNANFGALPGYSAVEHFGTLRLGTAGIFCGWVLQGYSADIRRLGTPGIRTLHWILCGGGTTRRARRTTPL